MKIHKRKNTLERERERLCNIFFDGKIHSVNKDELIKQSHKVDKMIMRAQKTIWKTYKSEMKE